MNREQVATWRRWDEACFVNKTLCCFVSSSGTATLLHSAGEHGGGRGRRRQPDLCRGGFTDAVRSLAPWLGRRAVGRRSARRADADRQERPAAERRPTDGHVHVRRVVRARQHRTPCRGPRQRWARQRPRASHRCKSGWNDAGDAEADPEVLVGGEVWGPSPEKKNGFLVWNGVLGDTLH